MAAVEKWDQYLLVRGEYNAICTVMEFPDALVAELEQAKQRAGDDHGRFGTGETGYTRG